MDDSSEIIFFDMHDLLTSLVFTVPSFFFFLYFLPFSYSYLETELRLNMSVVINDALILQRSRCIDRSPCRIALLPCAGV